MRFWKFVSPCPNTGCWLWVGAYQRKGYGHIGIGRRGQGNITASRLSFLIHHGPIPDGMFVLHKCDNPTCVNPDHLFCGTNADNMADCKSKGRARGKDEPLRGEDHHLTVLTSDDVRLIRSSKGTCADVGKSFGVSSSTVWNIRNKKTWSHVE